MSDIHFKCDECGKHLAVDERGKGSWVRCPDCAAEMVVPNPGYAICCPTCKARLLVAEEMVGATGLCSSCKTTAQFQESLLERLGVGLSGSRGAQTSEAHSLGQWLKRLAPKTRIKRSAPWHRPTPERKGVGVSHHGEARWWTICLTVLLCSVAVGTVAGVKTNSLIGILTFVASFWFLCILAEALSPEFHARAEQNRRLAAMYRSSQKPDTAPQSAGELFAKIAVVALFLVAGFFVWNWWMKPYPSVEHRGEAEPAALGKPGIEESHDDQVEDVATMVAVLKANELQFCDIYRNRRARLSGYVSNISQDITGTPYIELSELVNCYMKRSERAKAKNLSMGDRVAIEGTVRLTVWGYLMVQDCKFIQK